MVSVRAGTNTTPVVDGQNAIDVEDLSLWYGSFNAIRHVSLGMERHRITSLIGPSGCGKSTLIRCLNRMNDLVPTVRVTGRAMFNGIDIYDPKSDAVEVRRRIGMVFQKPNPFPKSIYENVAFGPRVNGLKVNMDEVVERSLRQAALWDEVKDKLQQSGLALSGGQQQRLCIARALAIEPEVILMDEPCSALDPIATYRIEELMVELKQRYTIIIVTHSMQQASRISDWTAFMLAGEDRTGELVEYGATRDLFTNPRDKRTEDYITGRFG